MEWKLQENVLNREDISKLTEFIQTTNRFTQFSMVKAFEETWSKWQGCKYSVFVNSGSSANLVLISAMKELYQWECGDEIIVPAVTWVTNISPIQQLGLEPVFVDINLEDLSFDYEKLESNITGKTRAIFVTHLIGFPANIERIKKAAGNSQISLMEDCCESHGAVIDQTKVGNFGDGGTFSFYWGHHMTTVEGGVICTNNEELFKLCVLKRSHGLARELPIIYHDYYRNQYPDIDFNFLFLTDGFNVRNTEFNAVLGVSQVAEIDKFIEIRNGNYKKFISICSEYDNQLILFNPEGISSFCLPFLFRDKRLKRIFQKALAEAGIESRPLISGNLLRQPFLKEYYVPGKFANADLIHDNAFYIGNNQFVNHQRLEILDQIMKDVLGEGK